MESTSAQQPLLHLSRKGYLCNGGDLFGPVSQEQSLRMMTTTPCSCGMYLWGTKANIDYVAQCRDALNDFYTDFYTNVYPVRAGDLLRTPLKPWFAPLVHHDMPYEDYSLPLADGTSFQTSGSDPEMLGNALIGMTWILMLYCPVLDRELHKSADLSAVFANYNEYSRHKNFVDRLDTDLLHDVALDTQDAPDELKYTVVRLIDRYSAAFYLALVPAWNPHIMRMLTDAQYLRQAQINPVFRNPSSLLTHLRI